MEIRSETLVELEARRDHIIRSATERVLATTSGTGGRPAVDADTVSAGMNFTTQMLVNAMAVQEPAILEDQLSWARRRLPHDGVSDRMLLANLRIYAEVVGELLDPQSAGEVCGYVDRMIESLSRQLGAEVDANE